MIVLFPALCSLYTRRKGCSRPSLVELDARYRASVAGGRCRSARSFRLDCRSITFLVLEDLVRGSRYEGGNVVVGWEIFPAAHPKVALRRL